MPRTTTLSAYGLTLDLPNGWDGDIFLRDVPDDPIHGEQTANAVLHTANFGLPPQRGDFGSLAVERMGSGAVLLCLLEYDPEAATTPLFSRPVPRSLSVADFDPDRLQRPIPGQAGAQVFCRDEGRAFCLYSVLGSWLRRNALVPVVNEVLASLRIAPRTY